MNRIEPSTPAEGAIRPLSGAARQEAAEQLGLGGSGAAASQLRQFLTAAGQLGIDHDLLWGRFDNQGHLRQAVLMVPQVGGTAMVLTSPVAGPKQVEPMGRLLEAACQPLAQRRLALAQALIPPNEALQREGLERAGFWRLATLCYMRARIPRRPGSPDWPGEATLEPWREPLRGQFLRVLEATYEQTRDCPDLHGLRTTEDVLEGHRATGRFDPQLWTLLRLGGEPAGLMLLNPVPEAECVELVYLGIRPEYRGRGLGALLLQHGFLQCVEAGYRKMSLAADEANEPALGLYRGHGFRRIDRKLAMVRQLAPSRS